VRHFVGEAEAANGIPHPSIVKSLHVDVTDEGRVYQLREFVDGVTLGKRLELGPLTPGEAARLGAAVAEGLAAAHGHGVIHRDVKPHNLLLSAAGVRVVDFGIAKRLDPDPSLGHTRTQVRLGTPAYMSPEQLRAPHQLSGATDVYSLGVVLFEALAGTRPFARPESDALLPAHLVEPPPDLRARAGHVPLELATLLEACLAETPQTRPSSADLARSLAALADRYGAASAEVIGRESMLAAADRDDTK